MGETVLCGVHVCVCVCVCVRASVHVCVWGGGGGFQGKVPQTTLITNGTKNTHISCACL